jgi:2-polyprenyl-6-hydroxyphenyl methylase/3-demethylubiquinone-9 3-methyltransferase
MKSWRWRLAQFLEIRWWKRYLSDKNPEEYIRWKTAYWEQLLKELSPELTIYPGQRVLDAGCGPAGVFLALKQNQVVAIDPLLEAYGKLPHFRQNDYPYTTFIQSDIEQFESKEPFDIIFCLNAINHVADIQKAYDVLCGLLKPGGVLVISIDAHNYGMLKHLFRALPGDALHPHQYDLHEYDRFLASRGLVIHKTLMKDEGLIFNYYVQVASR